jgi:hypothetical protein
VVLLTYSFQAVVVTPEQRQVAVVRCLVMYYRCPWVRLACGETAAALLAGEQVTL